MTNTGDSLKDDSGDEDLSSMDISLHEKWRESYSLEMERLLQLMPKVELHVHLDGSFDPPLLYRHLRQELSSSSSSSSSSSNDTPDKEKTMEATRSILEKFPEWQELPYDPVNSPLALRRMISQAWNDFETFQSLCTCRGRASLIAMLHCFEVFLPIVQGDLAMLEQMAHDFVQRQAQQLVIYTEVRYSPHLLVLPRDAPAPQNDAATPPTITADQVVDAVTRGIQRGEQDFPQVTVKQILCCLSWKPEWSMDVVRLASERSESSMGVGASGSVVGVDIAAGEEHFDVNSEMHQPHLEAMQRAKELNLKVTVHAGEAGDASHVAFAVEKYHARRIGHGYRIVDHPSLVREMANSHIFFEVCPTSSVETGGWDWKRNNTTGQKNWKKHPARTMMEQGIKIGFNSDDPAVFHTSLMWQLRIAVGKMGLELSQVLQTMHDSIDAAFTNDAILKEKLHEQLREYQTRHEKEIRANVQRDVVPCCHRPTLLRQLTSDEFVERVAGFEKLVLAAEGSEKDEKNGPPDDHTFQKG